MDFAKKQLEKYGWREGKGLGKNEDGISAALKPKLKYDNAGVGHQQGKEFTNNWWDKVYSSALDNVQVESTDGQVKVNAKSEDAVEITTKSYSLKDLKKKNKSLEYGTFLKTAKLTQSGIVNFSTNSGDNESVPEPPASKIPQITDEELFAACGGRTAHKGARHGLKLSGKLSRIEKQERMLLKKLKNVSLTDDKHSIEKKIKKISKNKEKLSTRDLEENIHFLSLDDHDSRSSGSVTPKKKSKKKRVVSFNETVTSITIHDANAEKSPDQAGFDAEKREEFPVVKMLKIKDEDGTDEGIEQDCDTNSTEDNSSHKSFEEAQSNGEERLKKIRKKKNTATLRFLETVDELKTKHPKAHNHSLDESCKKCKKRKINVEVDDEDNGEGSNVKVGNMGSSNEEKTWGKRPKLDVCSKKSKKDKKKRRRQKKRQEKREINSITKSLDEKCKISDAE